MKLTVTLTLLLSCHSFLPTFIPSTRSPPSCRGHSFLDFLLPRSSLIVFGGWDDSNSLNDIWEFSLTNLHWQEIIPLSTDSPSNIQSAPRQNSGGFCSSIDEKFYIFGGRTIFGPENDFWVFDFKYMKWEKLYMKNAPIPRAIFGYTSFLENGKEFFLVQGGITLNGNSNDMHRLDLEKMAWEALEMNGEAPGADKGSHIHYYQGSILQVPGVPNLGLPCLGYLYSYSLERKEWTVISNKSSTFECRHFGKSLIFNDELFLLFGWLLHNSTDAEDIVKINLKTTNKAWEVLKTMPEEASNSYSLVKIKNKGYLFGGSKKSSDKSYNSLLEIDLKTFTFKVINEKIVMPQSRTRHTMVTINSNFYLFGGMNSETIFGDLWAFDMVNRTWKNVDAKGSLPSARYLHAAGSDGSAFVVWGGEDSSGMKNDLFIFNEFTLTWNQLDASSVEKPRPAKGACLVMKEKKIYIYGGNIGSVNSDELWEFQIGNCSYRLLSVGLRKVQYPYCWIENDLFFVSLGAYHSEQPSTKIDYFNLSSSTWSEYHNHSLNNMDSSQSIQAYINGSFLTIGGQAWMQTFRKKIRLLSPGSEEKVLKTDIDLWLYGSGFVYFHKSLFVFGGGIVSGNTLLSKIGHNLLLEINIEEICSELGCQPLCSRGTRVEEKKCKPCEVGTFSDKFGGLKCTECRPGTYNNQSGSTNECQCLPCSQGSFSDVPGASSCKACPENKTCLVGSKAPLDNLSTYMNDSVQPRLYEEPELREKIIIYQALVSVPLFLILIVFLMIKNLRNKLKFFDLFEDKHENKENSFLIKRKNKTGACFSFLFVIAALLMTCVTTLSYFNANVQESKGLVPLVVLSSEVSYFKFKEMSVQLFLRSYGGDCESPWFISSISQTLEGIQYSKKFESFKFINNETCKLSVFFQKGTIQTGASISLSITEPLSYASAIEVNLTCSSSIPNQISSIHSSIKATEGFVFIGKDPNKFSFLATPSLFKSEAKEWPSQETGFHISEMTRPVKGSQFKPHDLPVVYGLYVKVFIDLSSTGLLTTRLLRQDFLFFLGTLLGTVSGLFGIAGFVMNCFEVQAGKILMRRGKVENECIENPVDTNTTKAFDR